jgi:hypothetical protein
VTLSTPLNSAESMISIQAAAQSDVISDCAMRVQRAGEVNTEPAEYSYSPPEGSCGCYWESEATGVAPADCHTCTTAADCKKYTATPACNYGYCEAK